MLTLKLELAENSTLPTEVHTKVSTTGSDGWVSLSNPFLTKPNATAIISKSTPRSVFCAAGQSPTST